MHLESALSRFSNNLSRNGPFKDLHATELCTQHALEVFSYTDKIMVLDISMLQCSFASSSHLSSLPLSSVDHCHH